MAVTSLRSIRRRHTLLSKRNTPHYLWQLPVLQMDKLLLLLRVLTAIACACRSQDSQALKVRKRTEITIGQIVSCILTLPLFFQHCKAKIKTSGSQYSLKTSPKQSRAMYKALPAIRVISTIDTHIGRGSGERPNRGKWDGHTKPSYSSCRHNKYIPVRTTELDIPKNAGEVLPFHILNKDLPSLPKSSFETTPIGRNPVPMRSQNIV